MRTYGVRTNNFTESENSRLRGNTSRNSHPLRFLQRIAHQWADVIQRLHKEFGSENILNCRIFLSNTLLEDHDEIRHASKKCVIDEKNMGAAMTTVTTKGRGRECESSNFVSLTQRSCRPCGEWDRLQKPCIHAMALWTKLYVKQKSGQDMIHDLYGDVWLCKSMVSAFNTPDFTFGAYIPHEDELNIPASSDPDWMDPPPTSKAKKSGPKQGRIENNGLHDNGSRVGSKRHGKPRLVGDRFNASGSPLKRERYESSVGDEDQRNEAAKRQRFINCSHCHQTGHNIRSCRAKRAGGTGSDRQQPIRAYLIEDDLIHNKVKNQCPAAGTCRFLQQVWVGTTEDQWSDTFKEYGQMIDMRSNDWKGLEHNRMIEGNVVEAYLQLIAIRARSVSTDRSPPVMVMSSYFFQMWRQDKVRTWIRFRDGWLTHCFVLLIRRKC